MPRMMEEIVSHVLCSQPDMEVAGTMRKVDGLSGEVERARPDVVVLGRNDSALAAVLLEQSPRVKVLAVAEEGQDSWLYGLNPERVHLGDVSPANLVRAVQRAVRPRAASAWWNR